MPIKVAIVGRPNVGKSTLFNRLVGKRIALVDATPGVTRDRREGKARLADLEFRLIDTAGLEEGAGDALSSRMRRQTETALAEADVALYLIDALAGVTALDRHFAKLLHRQERPVILVANKAERKGASGGIHEAIALGFGEAVAISAEHGDGMADLHMALAAYVPTADGPAPSRRRKADVPLEATAAPIQIAIIGRPNVGKSTLINKLLGHDRVLTGPEPGLTRDSISIEWKYKGRDFHLIDTAGLRRKARVQEKLEKLSVADTLRALKYAEIAVLAIDAEHGVDRQDLAIAGHVLKEGRALVIAANKWDVVRDRGPALREIEYRLTETLAEAQGLAIVPVSARTGQGMDRLLTAALGVYDRWNCRISTAKLNRWLGHATEAHPPPAAKGRAVRLRYMTQTKSRPPTFVVFANRPAALPQSYMRYLGNSLREAFKLQGVVVRLQMRRGENPYV